MIMKRGRKSLWDELEMNDKLILVEGWARDGLTDQQMMDNLGVGKTTFYKWKDENAEFADALKRGKEVVDREVENALLKKALGFKETINQVKVTQSGEIIPYVVDVFYPPDTTAQIFWLKNRKPTEWRDKQEKEITGHMSFEQILDEIED